jgi:aminopeptidase N
MGARPEKADLTRTFRRLVLFAALPILAALLVWFLVSVRLPPSPPPPGIPLALAEDRASRIHSLRYDLSLRIPEHRQDPIRGRLLATFFLDDPKRPLALDFAQSADHLQRVIVDGLDVAVSLANGHVVMPRRSLKQGENVIELQFVAGDEPLNRSDDYLYSLFVPARASLALPCFDQPDLKARWKLSLELPAGWAAVSNGAALDSGAATGGGTMSFAETEPLPTYLFAFAAGRFTVEEGERDGRTFRMFHRETDAAKVARNRDAIFDLHAHALTWLQDYTGIPYPFGKFDFVLIPAFQFSGMEHAGAILYNAATLLLDESATQNQLLNRANVISHETSHMWFGDLVTMKWFNDVWMKEVFANFMAAKIVNPSFPAVNHDLRFLFQNYPSAYDVDRTAGANPIRQDLANLNEAGSLYGAIIYQKAPIVMRQLEGLMGEDVFRDGLRDYLKRYSFGNASWSDLIALLDARTPADLAAWSRAWVDEPGRPTVHTELEVDAGKIARLTLLQEDPQGRNIVWPEKLQLVVEGQPASGSAGKSATRSLAVSLDRARIDVTEADGSPTPKWILPQGGYGFFDLDPATIEYLSKSIAEIPDAYLRGSALVELWEAMLEGRVPPAQVLDDLLTALPRESDELNVQQMLDDVRVLFWRFTQADDRKPVAPKLEAVLRAGLTRARSTSLKGAWFSAFRSTATTPGAVAWLEEIWRHGVKVEGLPLSESDEADLAGDLALRDVPDAGDLLQTQLERFTNADRKARFAFILPALSREASVRDRFFESLKDPRNRRHEAWVLDAARYLHHPLRAAASRKYIRPALELVRGIQQTGDIFFPKRWADATLSGYQTIQTAAEVRAFIDHLPPDYPPRLRWVLLSSADPLFRAARLLNQ